MAGLRQSDSRCANEGYGGWDSFYPVPISAKKPLNSLLTAPAEAALVDLIYEFPIKNEQEGGTFYRRGAA